MVPPRSRSRHAKRLFVTVAATFVAAGAMAYSTGGGQQHHQDEAPTKFHVASNGGAYGAGDVVLETQQTDAGDGGAPDPGIGAGGSGVGSDPVTGGAPRGLYGPGDGHDGPASSNFMPNGEDGLMTLASYAAGRTGGQNSNNNSDHTPSGPRDGGVANGGGNPFAGSSAGGDGSSKLAGPDGNGGSGPNSGPVDGGSGGSGGFGSGAGGGGFLSGGSGSTGAGGSGGTGPTGGGSPPPVTGGLPPITSPPSNDDPTGGNPGDGGGKACTVTATNLRSE